METKMIQVPFNVGMAKKIQSGKVDGRIVSRDGRNVRVVCWDRKSGVTPLLALYEQENGTEAVNSLTINGRLFKDIDTILDLFLEIPEYITYKDGDIVVLGWGNVNKYCTWISIIKNITVIELDDYKIFTEDYVSVTLNASNKDYFDTEFDGETDTATWTRKPTEKEKQYLIESLKESEEPQAKEYLKRFFGIE